MADMEKFKKEAQDLLKALQDLAAEAKDLPKDIKTFETAYSKLEADCKGDASKGVKTFLTATGSALDTLDGLQQKAKGASAAYNDVEKALK